MKALMAIIGCLIGCLFSVAALAWPPTYGAEFEFYHPMMKAATFNRGEDPILGQAKLFYVDHIKKICEQKGCVVEKVDGKWWTMTDKDQAADYKVIMPDGWWFKISHDPGCVEITTKPSTLQELRAQRKIMDEMIFDSARAIGFRIQPMETAHFNIGIKAAFDNDPKEFLRFFVDYHNHPELVQGVLGDDINNAPSLAVLGQDQRGALKKLVSEVNAKNDFTLGSLAAAITGRVYTKSYNPEWGGAYHYQAVGLKYVNALSLAGNNDKPMELRATWNQKDAEHFIKVAELLEARFQFLKKQNTKIVYSGTRKQNFTTTEMVTRFYFYVTEMGLSYARYRELLPHYLRSVPFDVVLDEQAPMRDRLQNLKAYSDMLAFSPGFREYAQQLLAEAKASGRAFDLSFEQDLARARRVVPVSCELVHVQ
jgi:hypothetical protein